MKIASRTAKYNYTSTLKAVGTRLAELRIEKGYNSQYEFAIDHELSHIQYWRMERGLTNVTFKSLDRVLAIHGITIEQLFSSLPNNKKKSSARDN